MRITSCTIMESPIIDGIIIKVIKIIFDLG